MSETPKRTTAKAPISAHPAFPAIVGLWFAALLGMGSFVLPVSVFEGLSTATGLSSVVVAAQPPLGVTARILIAIAAAGIGAAGGLVLARKIAAANAPRQPKTQRAASLGRKPAGEAVFAKKPISAREELGDDGIEADEWDRDAMPGRRRALAVHDESARSEMLDLAPLPGSDPFAPAEPLDLGDFRPAASDEHIMADRPGAWASEEPFGTSTLSGRPVDNTYRRPWDAPAETLPPSASADFVEETTMDQPASFAPAFAAPAEPAAFEPAPFAPPPAPPVAAPPAAAAQDSIVDLVDRFARALESRRNVAPPVGPAAEEATPIVDLTFALGARPQAEMPSEPPAPFPPAFEADTRPRFAQPAPTVPAALQPLGFEIDDVDDDGPMPSFSLPLEGEAPSRPFAAPNALSSVEEDGVDDDADESYPSLLAMKSPFGLPREPVRIEDEDEGEASMIAEPVVVFPGQGTRESAPAPFGAATLRPFDGPAARAARPAPGAIPASADTERALREALEKLQRMSGAA